MNKSAVVFILLAFGITLSTPAFCQKERAKMLFDKGVAALEHKNFKTALSAFEEAYEISPHWAVLAHMGTCYANLNRPIKAIEVLEQYLQDGGNAIPEDERETANEIIRNQKRKIGILILSVEKPGVEALVDGESIGTAPFKEKRLKPGAHEVAVIFGEGDVVKRNFSIDAGQEYLLRVDQEQHLAAALPPPAPAVENTPEVKPKEPKVAMLTPEFSPPLAEEPTRKKGSLVPFGVSLGIAGASLVAASVGWGFFAHFKMSESNFEDYLNTIQKMDPRFEDFTWEKTCQVPEDEKNNLPGGKPAEHYCNTELNRREFADSAGKWIILGIAGSGVTVLASALAIVFYVNRDWFGDPSEMQTSTLQVLPMIGPRTTGMTLNFQF